MAPGHVDAPLIAEAKTIPDTMTFAQRFKQMFNIDIRMIKQLFTNISGERCDHIMVSCLLHSSLQH
jgi:hypothetical protein